MPLPFDALAPDGPIVSALRSAFPTALAVYAFGSHVAQTANEQSDLDLAILVAGYAEPLRLWDVSLALSETAQCPVDLLDLRAASTVMQHQIMTTGKRLWSKDVQAGLFECYVLSEKTALDAARAGLLGDIRRTGKIHAR
jgi:predicted nucleotidyltransferase